ncbi:MAG: PD40 domain-containing protein [Flavobacteriia bacterium]|nr:PD40 domain-containing protein [Flavobacteriia bacterium]
MKNLILILFIVLNGSFIFAQKNEMQIRKDARTLSEFDLVAECSQLIGDGYLYYAEILTDKLLEFQPESSNYNYRKGFIILNSRKNAAEAIPYLEKAILKTHKNYDLFSTSEQNAALDAFYHLAKAYHADGQIDKAILNYNRFIEVTQKKSPSIGDAQLCLIQCEVAKKLMENPKNVKVINLGEEVNTSFPEYSPFISLDGSALYFTSRRSWEEHSTEQFKDPTLNEYHEDIYVCYKDEKGEWSSPTRLDFCEDERNEASISVSPDERRVYIYQDNKGGGDIFYSDFKLNSFTEINDLKYSGVNTASWETHCTMTIDGLNMYFVSNRPGGLGGRDIYRIVKMPDGSWSLPQNLGPTINTPYDEDCPFIAADNKTLYYSSNGPESMGLFDIFMTIRDEDNVWQTPINVGYPINSTGDDVFYTTTVDGYKGYLTSDRKGSFGEKDIYEIQNDYLGTPNVTVLKGKIRTVRNTPIPQDIVVTLKNISYAEKPEVSVHPRLRDGSFFSSLEPCSEYEMIFYSKEGTLELYREKFSTSCEKRYEEVRKEVMLKSDELKFIPIMVYGLSGVIEDKKTHQQIDGAHVEIVAYSAGTVIDVKDTDKTGYFVSNVANDYYFGDSLKLKFKVSKEGYLTQTFDFTYLLDSNSKIEVKYELERNELGMDLAKVLDLKPIYFDLGKFNIRADAKIELDKIVKVMNDNPTIHVELGSHTDCRSSATFNLALSDKRAKTSADYIKKRISHPERITGKGYGETKLVNQCECEGEKVTPCSEAEHQANRRTEFNVVKN